MPERRRILWIDDEIETLRSHVLLLESRGYEVVPATNGQDGLSLVFDQSFDAVLLDHRMAGMDGLTVLEELKDRRPHLPVVMITQSQEEDVLDDALRQRTDGFLVKPVQAVQVAHTLKRVIDQQRLKAEATPQQFLKDYRELMEMKSGSPSWKEWIDIYERLVVWDMRMDDLERAGLAQSHRELRDECNALFAERGRAGKTLRCSRSM